MLKRYFNWLRKTLPQSAWESLEPELDILETTLPLLKETRKNWRNRVLIIWWIARLLLQGITEFIYEQANLTWRNLEILHRFTQRKENNSQDIFTHACFKSSRHFRVSIDQYDAWNELNKIIENDLKENGIEISIEDYDTYKKIMLSIYTEQDLFNYFLEDIANVSKRNEDI